MGFRPPVLCMEAMVWPDAVWFLTVMLYCSLVKHTIRYHGLLAGSQVHVRSLEEVPAKLLQCECEVRQRLQKEDSVAGRSLNSALPVPTPAASASTS